MKSQKYGTFGERIREERVRLGLSQSAFALRVGTSKTSQTNYEAGAYTPDLAYLAAAGAIGVDTGFVLTSLREATRTAASFNWQLAEDILQRVDEWAVLQPTPPSAAEKMYWIRLFYSQFCGEGDVNEAAVDSTFRHSPARR